MTRWLPLCLLLTLVGCNDAGGGRRGERDLPGEDPNPTSPTPAPTLNTFEYRVIGNPGNFRRTDIRWSSTQEGTSLVSSQLPWTSSIRTFDNSSFLTLSARQISLGADEDDITFLQIQVLVNGSVFREASAPGPNASVSVTGQWTGR